RSSGGWRPRRGCWCRRRYGGDSRSSAAVLEADGGVRIELFAANRDVTVALRREARHQVELADELRRDRGHRFDIGVEVTGFNRHLVGEVRAFAEVEKVAQRQPADVFILFRAVGPVRLPATDTDFQVKALPVALEEPAAITYGLAGAPIEAREFVGLPVEREKQVVLLTQLAVGLVTGPVVPRGGGLGVLGMDRVHDGAVAPVGPVPAQDELAVQVGGVGIATRGDVTELGAAGELVGLIGERHRGTS